MSAQPQHECHSVHSWWSDSNSVGPTIPLHTFAKPLAKFLHHRQVTSLLTKYRPSPLSAELLDLLTIYLESKEISSATKSLILGDLNHRAAQESGARVILEENGLSTLILLLDSNNADILEAASDVLGRIAWFKSLNARIVSLYPFGRIVSLARNSNRTVRKNSLYALGCLSALSWEASRAIMDAGVMNMARHLLESGETDFLQYQVLDGLVRRHSLRTRVARLVPYHCLFAAVQQTENPTSKDAMSILLIISEGDLSSVQAIAADSNFRRIRKILDSTSPPVVQFACRILGNIAQHDSLVESVVQFALPLVSILRNTETGTNEATYALPQFCRVEVGMHNVFNVLLKLLRLGDEAVVETRCRHFLDELIQNAILDTTIANAACCVYLYLVSFTSSSTFQDKLAYALQQVSDHPDLGSRAVADAVNKVLSSSDFLDLNPSVLAPLCRMLGRITFICPALADTAQASHLVPLLANEDSGVQAAAEYMFLCLYGKPGATNVAEILPQLLSETATRSQSLDPIILEQICLVLGDVALSSQNVAQSVEALALAPLLLIDDLKVKLAVVHLFRCVYKISEQYSHPNSAVDYCHLAATISESHGDIPTLSEVCV
ncbi:hypothetical protein MVEN_00332100 [Mycena venus]|uniref:ARM repeat-containing protein n=1 Tax=Mycena venus TaxID=2733690 RepID=A0A8H6YQZ8_9AGAR|nr:hypothetical protein MVEN_00332100 [Mycena venus]